MLPDVADALVGWKLPIMLKTVIKTTVDFEPVETVTVEQIHAVIQPTQKTRLNADTLDWSQAHITLHTTDLLQIGQVVEFQNADYEIVEVADFTMYGYCESVAQATNRPLLVTT